MLKTKQEEICARFNSFDLHDSKLLSVHVVRNESGHSDDVLLDINLHPWRGELNGKGAQLRFNDCTIIKLDLDLDGKRVCSDDIMCNVALSIRALSSVLRRSSFLMRTNHWLITCTSVSK